MALYLASMDNGYSIIYAAIISAETKARAEEIARADSENHFDELRVVAIETPAAEGVLARAE